MNTVTRCGAFCEFGSKGSVEIARFVNDESGATAIEYGLIAAGIAGAIATVVGTVGTNLTSLFSNVASKLTVS